jgi:hypothetical protein
MDMRGTIGKEDGAGWAEQTYISRSMYYQKALHLLEGW